MSTETLVERGLKIGKNFSRQGGCRIDASYPFLIEIGNNVGLSTEVTILTHDNSLKRHSGILKLGKVKIGNNVFIGAKSLILPNVRIGNNVIVGAGSVVTKDIPDNVVCAGNPARILCTLDDYVAKFNAKITAENLVGQDYTPLTLDKGKKMRLKELTNSDFCYMKSENYDALHKKG